MKDGSIVDVEMVGGVFAICPQDKSQVITRMNGTCVKAPRDCDGRCGGNSCGAHTVNKLSHL